MKPSQAFKVRMLAALALLGGAIAFNSKAAVVLPVIEITANTAYSEQIGELCVLTVNDNTELYQGDCSSLAQAVYNQLRKDYPTAVVGLTINGSNYNTI